MTEEERIAELEAEVTQLRADLTEARAQAAPPEASISAAVMADRQRRRTIMALPEAEGRADLAEELFAAGLEPDAAKRALAVAPAAAGEARPRLSDAELHAHRRLNGEGLRGASPRMSNISQDAASERAVAKMRKLTANMLPDGQ